MEKYAPVASNKTTRMNLVITMYYGDEDCICESVNIEATFFDGNNSEFQYTWDSDIGICHQEEVKQTCLQMLQCIYGNVEAALMLYTAYA